jgi:hypothetical protein
LAFGGIIAGSAERRKGPPMTAYPAVIANKFDFEVRQRYPYSRSDFRPAAYVVLTRVSGVALEGYDG